MNLGDACRMLTREGADVVVASQSIGEEGCAALSGSDRGIGDREETDSVQASSTDGDEPLDGAKAAKNWATRYGHATVQCSTPLAQAPAEHRR